MNIMQGATLSQKPQTLEKQASGRDQRLVGKPRYPETTYLPLNAESRMVNAVRFASHIRSPITTVLTVNAAHLQRIGSPSVFEVGHLWDGYRDFLELLRKWVTGRRVTWSCIWVREYTGGRNDHHGEHWHIAFYLPPHHQNDLAAQVAIWTGEALRASDGKKTCIARSITGAWYLSRSRDNAGEYLGKATPRTRSRYGRKVPNDLRGSRHRGGGEGPIQGKRFGISRAIGDTAQRRQGWQWCKEGPQRPSQRVYAESVDQPYQHPPIALSGPLRPLEKQSKDFSMSRGGNRPSAGRPAGAQNADTAAM